MVYLHRCGDPSAPLQAQQLHLSEASLQMQPWEHFAQPTGQQEQQLFLQEVHLHCLHLQAPAQEQDPSEAQEQLGEVALRRRP